MVNKTPLCPSKEVGTCPNFPKCRPFSQAYATVRLLLWQIVLKQLNITTI